MRFCFLSHLLLPILDILTDSISIMVKTKTKPAAKKPHSKVPLVINKRSLAPFMNKEKRAQVVAKQQLEKNKLRFERRMQRRKDQQELGAEPLKPATVDSKRVCCLGDFVSFLCLPCIFFVNP